MKNSKQKIFVGLSGGVDSAVSAALLKRQGNDVTGVFIKVWQADFLPCSWKEERRDAMRIAGHLGIPFTTLDLEHEYKTEVVDYMIREYGAGRIPNPDVMCNKYVKFGAFLDFALSEGADSVATGHYAQRESLSKRIRLLEGIDKEKDQSYFLWTITQDQLAHIQFPVGELRKSEVRNFAKEFSLPNAGKKDSQGLCFMGSVDMPQFLKHFLKTKIGDVLNEMGDIIGTHDGAILYTIGQRHGFHTIKQSGNDMPYIVIHKNMEKNTITVSHEKNIPKNDLRSSIGISQLNLIEPIESETSINNIHARMRYRGEKISVSIKNIDYSSKTASVVFLNSEELVSPGQSMVFYSDTACLGGGVMETREDI